MGMSEHKPRYRDLQNDPFISNLSEDRYRMRQDEVALAKEIVGVKATLGRLIERLRAKGILTVSDMSYSGKEIRKDDESARAAARMDSLRKAREAKDTAKG